MGAIEELRRKRAQARRGRERERDRKDPEQEDERSPTGRGQEPEQEQKQAQEPGTAPEPKTIKLRDALPPPQREELERDLEEPERESSQPSRGNFLRDFADKLLPSHRPWEELETPVAAPATPAHTPDEAVEMEVADQDADSADDQKRARTSLLAGLGVAVALIVVIGFYAWRALTGAARAPDLHSTPTRAPDGDSRAVEEGSGAEEVRHGRSPRPEPEAGTTDDIYRQFFADPERNR